MRSFFHALTVIAVAWSGTATVTVAQQVVSTPAIADSAAQGVCPRCGKVHALPAEAETIVSSAPAGSALQTVSYETVAAGPGSSSPGLRVAGGVRNVLAALNAQRARQGIAGLRYDPVLQAVAQRRAQQMASTGTKSHPPGSFAPGRYEGVGWSSSYSPSAVSACYTSDPGMRYAGAAMATGRDGVYFAVVYR